MDFAILFDKDKISAFAIWFMNYQNTTSIILLPWKLPTTQHRDQIIAFHSFRVYKKFIQKLLNEERFHLFPSFTLCTHPPLLLSSFIQQLHAQYPSSSPATLCVNFCHTPVWCDTNFIFDFWVWERVAWKSVFIAFASMSSRFCFIDVS